VKIVEAIFSSDGTYVRLETGKEKFYASKGKFYDCCPVNCFAKVVSSTLSKEIQSAVDKGGYNQVSEVKKFIKDSAK
jgi:hypothetical protein